MFKIYFDGATHLGNPTNKIGYGVVFGKEEYKKSLTSPTNNLTNNVAEYYGMGLSLKLIKESLRVKTKFVIYGDSKMVCKQMNGLWRIKDGAYREAANICKKLLKHLREEGYDITIKWIPREKNEHADQLSKEALLL